jgi:hypothetical protein
MAEALPAAGTASRTGRRWLRNTSEWVPEADGDTPNPAGPAAGGDVVSEFVVEAPRLLNDFMPAGHLYYNPTRRRRDLTGS